MLLKIIKSCKYIFFICLIFSGTALFSTPYQLVESESAVLNTKGGLEKKLNYYYETGYVPAHLMALRLRYGLIKRLEGGGYVAGAYFPDNDVKRVSEAGGTLKGQVWKSKPYGFNLYAFGHYRHTIGDPVIREFDEDDDPPADDIVGIMSPRADGGRDISVGLVGKNSTKRFGKRLFFMAGLTYTYMREREFEEFEKENHHHYTAMVTPIYHTSKYTMFALENSCNYWQGRGVYYSVMPQFRWEFIQYWVIEFGVSVPVMGAKNYRFTVGINQGSG